jgi:anti-sigma factor RsiW
MQQSGIQNQAPIPPLRISRDDLLAYAEGRLDRSRRTDVAGFLACNPDLAAEVMRVVHLQERSRDAGQALTPATGRGRRAARLAAACTACAIAGWAFAAGLDEDGPLQGLLKAPEYVEDAVMSWRATDLRIAMNSQTQTATLDTEELRQRMQIRVPVLPGGWRLLDAQVYPSEAGPGISMLLETAPGRQVNLFAVRSDTAASGSPQITVRNGAYAAYWEFEGAAYVLTGAGSQDEILAQASQLSRNGLM